MTCGGTGGHIMPALAIADTVRDNYKNAEILFIGAKGGMEEGLVTAAGYPITTLEVRGIARSLSLSNIKAMQLAYRASRKAREIIRDYSPDIVIGTGGYACYPALSAAASLGIPCAVHESNAVPGLAVKRLASRMDRVWLNFAAAAELLPAGSRPLVLGNPMRGCGQASKPLALPGRCRHTVLSFGGSLGAAEINRAVLELMEAEAGREEIFHLHATGKREYESVWGEFVARGLNKCHNLLILPFIDDMPSRMAAADLVICRAGAMSISELALAGCAAILIPSPNVTGNHQYKNARLLADAGAALLLCEQELSGDRLKQEVFGLLDDPARRQVLSRKIKAFASSNANREILEDMLRIMERKKRPPKE